MTRSGALLLAALLAACGAEERDAEPVIPPAEPRPANIGGIKWAPESPRWQQMRTEAWREGDDFTAKVDFAPEAVSRKGLYRLRRMDGGTALGEFMRWRVRLRDEQGRPVAGAQIGIRGGMPEHGHGLPTQPKVTPTDTPGEYLVEGLQFGMPGWWEVSFYISSRQRDDSVTLNVKAG